MQPPASCRRTARVAPLSMTPRYVKAGGRRRKKGGEKKEEKKRGGSVSCERAVLYWGPRPVLTSLSSSIPPTALRREGSARAGQAVLPIHHGRVVRGDEEPAAHRQEDGAVAEDARGLAALPQQRRAQRHLVQGLRPRQPRAREAGRVAGDPRRRHLLPPGRVAVAHERAVRAQEEVRRDLRGHALHQGHREPQGAAQAPGRGAGQAPHLRGAVPHRQGEGRQGREALPAPAGRDRGHARPVRRPHRRHERPPGPHPPQA
ncbi:hypothetical protein VTK73DRAFT_2618 [Phialemonium thermophilum]|uniref:Uncharacterized protein n=1 Tax=Phialemonium thermophilum TaxID=223376 RepID=A0ABR3VQT7_9PEZI